MNSKTFETYQHYKAIYAPMLMLFRVRNNYEAYFDDASVIAGMLGEQVHTDYDEDGVAIEKVVLPSAGILDVVGKIYDCGKECKLISYRNNTGDFTIPDIHKLRTEQEIDY